MKSTILCAGVAHCVRSAADGPHPHADDFLKAAADEQAVRTGFWPKVTRVAGNLPFAEDLLAAYYCAFDRNTPHQVRVILFGALAYFVMPIDAVPDFLPLFGFADDAAMLAAALKAVSDAIRPEHRDAARRKLAQVKTWRLKAPEHASGSNTAPGGQSPALRTGSPKRPRLMCRMR